MAETSVIIKLLMQGAGAVVSGFGQINQALTQHVANWQSYNKSLSNGSLEIQRYLRYAAGFVSAQQIRAGLQDAEAQIAAQARLSQALVTTGNTSEEIARTFIDQANSLELLTGTSNDMVMAIQSVLLSLGATADQARQLTPLVLDMSAAMGQKPLEAARALGAALDGQVIKVGQFNIVARDMDDLISQLSASVEGQAEAMQRAKGPLGELSVLYDNTRKALAFVALEPINKFLDGFNEALIRIYNSLNNVNPSLQVFLGSLGSVTGQLAGSMLPALAAITAALLALKIAFSGISTAANVFRSIVVLLTGASGQFFAAFQSAPTLFNGLTLGIKSCGAAFLALGVSIAGFELGKAIGQINIFGDTIENHLIKAIYKAQIAWLNLRNAFGIIDLKDYADQLSTLNAALGPSPYSQPNQTPGTGGAASSYPILGDDQTAAIQRQIEAARNSEKQSELEMWGAQQSRNALLGEEQIRQRSLLAISSQIFQIDKERSQIQADIIVAQDQQSDIQNGLAQLDPWGHPEEAKQFLSLNKEDLQLELQLTQLREKENQLLAKKYQLQRQQPPPDTWSQGVTSFQNWTNQVQSRAAIVAQTLTGVVGSAINGISDGIMGLIEGTKTWGQMFLEVGRMILQSLIQVAVQMAVIGGIRMALGMTFFPLFGMAEGGLVPGAPSARDNRIAAIATGEYIVRSAAVQHYGAGFFDALNSMRIPQPSLADLRLANPSARFGYASGGLVTPLDGRQGMGNISVAPAPVHVAILKDPRELQDFLTSRAGQKIIINTIAGNKNAIGLRA
ncbi:MAG: hypothetical protein M1608_17415 [Candidatus Omnitrophica bacterium]|nr:hypothetical protein [Candidatus Omnitrophota bacterium]